MGRLGQESRQECCCPRGASGDGENGTQLVVSPVEGEGGSRGPWGGSSVRRGSSTEHRRPSLGVEQKQDKNSCSCGTYSSGRRGEKRSHGKKRGNTNGREGVGPGGMSPDQMERSWRASLRRRREQWTEEMRSGCAGVWEKTKPRRGCRRRRRCCGSRLRARQGAPAQPAGPPGRGHGGAAALISLPACPGQTESRGRLQGVAELRLAGLELTDASLRLLLRHAPQLSALDLSHCAHVGDPSVHLLTAPTSPLRETLVHLNLAGKHPVCRPAGVLVPVASAHPPTNLCGLRSHCLTPPQVATASRTTASRCSAAARACAA